jgi:hypothetical protein
MLNATKRIARLERIADRRCGRRRGRLRSSGRRNGTRWIGRATATGGQQHDQEEGEQTSHASHTPRRVRCRK